MNRFRNTVVLLLVFFVNALNAQDFPYHYYSHINPMLNNPSFACFNSNMAADIAVHNVWAGGFKPLNDYMLSFSFAPKGQKHKRNYGFQPDVGLGLAFLKEQIGPFEQNILQLIYAYHIQLNRATVLSLGLSGIVENLAINVTSLSPLEGDDPRLLTGNNNAFILDGGFGAAIHGEKYSIALSVLNLAPGDYSFDNAAIADIENYRKYYVSSSYTFQLYDKIHFEPGMTLRNSRLERFCYDTSVAFDFTHLKVGLGYRSENSIFIYTQIPVRKLMFSYTSENALNSTHMVGNAHTFSIGWKLTQ
ncbi:PorP/SprF family type IX secretion system membrane protein [Prolixibacteraceae bacterium Z1-6]|uniref:PorP/SprF family type IX secretion system membrane protein n=1 Tax=Draconibacterium aestuarii TaxID=2998507 RepID=A0A9X3JA11_9BACT|nr:PorP/SprF family type IX secretion system membrane protein [Prolixibacteraceae bacterium Z1-6]